MPHNRTLRAGTRVRFKTPGYSFNGTCGTLGSTAYPDGVAIVLMDGRGQSAKATCTVTTEQLARMRDQTPRAEHQPADGKWDFGWWAYR